MRQKTFSSERPKKPFQIENVRNGYCTVLFFDNIEEFEDEEGNTNYKYDLYVLDKVNYRETLEDTITNDAEEWLSKAIELDYQDASKQIRAKRDKLLSETDWTQMKDTALTKTEVQRYAGYRQALRDIPQQEGFPYDVEFPTLEEG